MVVMSDVPAGVARQVNTVKYVKSHGDLVSRHQVGGVTQFPAITTPTMVTMRFYLILVLSFLLILTAVAVVRFSYGSSGSVER